MRLLHPDNALTPREKEIIGMLANGETNAFIASFMGNSEQVIKNHVRDIYRKLGCDNRVQCAVWWAASRDRAKIRSLTEQLKKVTETAEALERWKRRMLR